MNEQICFKINGMSLYVDEYLVDFDIPIFYICKNDIGEKFSVVCVNSHSMEYLVSATTNDDILKMLKSEMLLRDFVLKAKKNWYIKSGDSIEEDQVEQISTIPEEFLPKSGEFLDLPNARIQAYQKKIEQEIASLPKFSELFDSYYTDISTQTFVSFIDYKQVLQNIVISFKRSSLSKKYFSHSFNLKTSRREILCR